MIYSKLIFPHSLDYFIFISKLHKCYLKHDLFFSLSRLYSKLITSSMEERLENLKMSLQYYQFVTSYADVNEDASECISVELELCREMVDVLPKTMDKIRTALASN